MYFVLFKELVCRAVLYFLNGCELINLILPDLCECALMLFFFFRRTPPLLDGQWKMCLPFDLNVAYNVIVIIVI